MSSNMFAIALMPGDGIGVEVMDAAAEVMAAVETRFGLGFRYEPVPGGAHHYRETGAVLPADGMDRARRADAILFGAMGWPDIRYRRRHRDRAAARPSRVGSTCMPACGRSGPSRACRPRWPSPRRARSTSSSCAKSTEGMFASRGKGEIIDDMEAARHAGHHAAHHRAADATSPAGSPAAARRERGTPGRVTLVDKANVFRSFAFMRKVFYEAAAATPTSRPGTTTWTPWRSTSCAAPGTSTCCRPRTCSATSSRTSRAGLIGGMGFAPSADIGDEHGVFQPSHGIGPRHRGPGHRQPDGDDPLGRA